MAKKTSPPKNKPPQGASDKYSPPPGVKRVIIDSNHQELIVYAEGERTAWRYKQFQRLNTPAKIRRAFEGMGYRRTNRKKSFYIYDRDDL